MILKSSNLLFAYYLHMTHTLGHVHQHQSPIPTFFPTLNLLSPDPGLSGRGEENPSCLLGLSGSGDPMFVNTVVSRTSAELDYK